MKSKNRGIKTLNFFKNKFVERIPFESLYRVNLGMDIDENLAFRSLRKILAIKEEGVRTALLSMLLNGLMIKGPNRDEVVGLLKAALSLDGILFRKKPKAGLNNGQRIIGYAGSGKKGIKTVNISTPAAILAASAGVYIAKACSSSTSSITGSADFLSLVGINFEKTLKKNIRLLKETNIAFFSMENATPKFAKIYGGRFFTPHALSFALAGLSLPVEVDTMLYGLAHPNIRLSAEIFEEFGYKDIMIISTTEDGVHYIDEVGVSGTLSVVGIKKGVLGKTASCSPVRELNLGRHTMSDLKQGKDRVANVKTALLALTGKGKVAYVDAICGNAGLLIYLAGKAKNFSEGYEIAKKNLFDGKGFEKLLEIIKKSGGNANKLKRFM